MPGIILGAGVMTIDKRDENTCLHGSYKVMYHFIYSYIK